MELTSTMAEASLSAINETLMQIRVTLGRMAARQDQMLVDSKKILAMLAPAVATTPVLGLGRALEQATKTSPSSLFSAVQVAGAGPSHADAAVASAMPTRCSTKSPGHYTNNAHADLVFPASGTTHVPAMTSVTQSRDPTAAGYEEILTHVGGVSLFFEHSVQPAEVVFSELHSMELEGEVLSAIGGLSLFPEEGLGSTHEVCAVVLLEGMFAARHVEDIACGKELADQMLAAVEILSVFTDTDLETR
jgi:hypothetical protein